MDKAPSVEVAIPVYNGAQYIREAIDSVLLQEPLPPDLTVLDNASTDTTRDVLATYFPTVRVQRHAQNLGAITNFNLAAKQAKADYFAWLGHDDRFGPSFVQSAISEIQQHPDAVAVLPTVQYIDADGNVVGRKVPSHRYSSPYVRYRVRELLNQDRWCEIYAVYRRAPLLKTGLLRECFGADVIFTWELLLRYPMAVCESAVLEYRVAQAKTPQDMANALYPPTRTGSTRFAKWKQWRAMWHLAAAPDLDRHTTMTARQELVMALLRKSWRVHLLEDVMVELGRRQSLAVGDVSSNLLRAATLGVRAIRTVNLRLTPLAWAWNLRLCRSHRHAVQSPLARRRC